MNTAKILTLLNTTPESKIALQKRIERPVVLAAESANDLLNAELFGSTKKQFTAKPPVRAAAKEGMSRASQRRATEESEGEVEFISTDIVDDTGDVLAFFDYKADTLPAEVVDTITKAVEDEGLLVQLHEEEDIADEAVATERQNRKLKVLRHAKEAVEAGASKEGVKALGSGRYEVTNGKDVLTVVDLSNSVESLDDVDFVIELLNNYGASEFPQGRLFLCEPDEAGNGGIRNIRGKYFDYAAGKLYPVEVKASTESVRRARSRKIAKEMLVETTESAFPESFDFDEESFAEDYDIDKDTVSAVYVSADVDADIPAHLEVSFEYDDAKVLLSISESLEVSETVDAEIIEPAQFSARFEEEELEDGSTRSVLVFDLVDEDSGIVKSEGDVQTKSEGDEEHSDEDGKNITDEFIEEAGLGQDEWYAKSHNIPVDPNPGDRIDPVYGTARANESIAARIARTRRATEVMTGGKPKAQKDIKNRRR